METVSKIALGQLISRKRIAQGLSIPALARLVGVHRANVLKVEKGENFPAKSLPAYVEALDLTYDELVDATGLSDGELIGLGVTIPHYPDLPDQFTRDQINPGWFGPVDLHQFVH